MWIITDEGFRRKLKRLNRFSCRLASWRLQPWKPYTYPIGKMENLYTVAQYVAKWYMPVLNRSMWWYCHTSTYFFISCSTRRQIHKGHSKDNICMSCLLLLPGGIASIYVVFGSHVHIEYILNLSPFVVWRVDYPITCKFTLPPPLPQASPLTRPCQWC